MIRLPTNRVPIHPGEMLLEEFLRPMSVSQVELAEKLRIPFQRVNQIIKGKRSITPDTALRLAKVLGTSVDVWLNLQLAWDLYEAQHSPKAKEIAQLEKIA
ncbi:MAG TPA: HigA family addiction module antitoxin [Gemmatimonadaceae bacterium]|nr:HigA family addiction module antitoxin [Gemmatimonadaceae bacterium]